MPVLDTVIIDATFVDLDIGSHLSLVDAFKALERLRPVCKPTKNRSLATFFPVSSSRYTYNHGLNAFPAPVGFALLSMLTSESARKVVSHATVGSCLGGSHK